MEKTHLFYAVVLFDSTSALSLQEGGGEEPNKTTKNNGLLPKYSNTMSI